MLSRKRCNCSSAGGEAAAAARQAGWGSGGGGRLLRRCSASPLFLFSCLVRSSWRASRSARISSSSSCCASSASRWALILAAFSARHRSYCCCAACSRFFRVCLSRWAATTTIAIASFRFADWCNAFLSCHFSATCFRFEQFGSYSGPIAEFEFEDDRDCDLDADAAPPIPLNQDDDCCVVLFAFLSIHLANARSASACLSSSPFNCRNAERKAHRNYSNYKHAIFW